MSKVKYALMLLIFSTISLKPFRKKIVKVSPSTVEEAVAQLSMIGTFLALLCNWESELNNKPKNISTAFNSLEKVCKICSKLELPQYKYIAKPVYIYSGGNKNPLISTPLSFAITDLLMHRILPTLFVLLILRKRTKYLDLLQYFKKILLNTSNLTGFTAWTTLGAGVGYQKHIRNKTKLVEEI